MPPIPPSNRQRRRGPPVMFRILVIMRLHKLLVGRLDNSAVSATGAKLAFKSNEEIAVQVRTVPLDDVIPESEPVLVLKIDVQGWEYHVLKGDKKLPSRAASEAPYLIYEEDGCLLEASNSSKVEILFSSVGYRHCTQHGTDAHYQGGLTHISCLEFCHKKQYQTIVEKILRQITRT